MVTLDLGENWSTARLDLMGLTGPPGRHSEVDSHRTLL